MKQETFTRGQVAINSGVGIETVRFYEQKGLVAKPKRTRAGYRQYTAEVIKQIQFITKAKELGFSLKEVLELLSLRINTKSKCRDVKLVATEKIKEIDKKIAGLKTVKKSLMSLVKSCQANKPTSECPLLDSLNDEESSPC